MLGFQGGVSIPLVKGGVKAPPAKRQCRAGPKAGARRGFTFAYYHQWRTHLSLAMDCPEPRPAHAPGGGRVVAVPEGGACITITSDG